MPERSPSARSERESRGSHQRRITIEVIFDDARWHHEDARQVARAAANVAAQAARHHHGARVELDGERVRLTEEVLGA